MEHGLQTHTVPDAGDAQVLIAHRMGFASPNDFVAVLKTHTTHVRNTYERLFSDVEETSQQKVDAPTIVIDKDAALATAAARVLAQHISTDRAGTELVSGQHVRPSAVAPG